MTDLRSACSDSLVHPSFFSSSTTFPAQKHLPACHHQLSDITLRFLPIDSFGSKHKLLGVRFIFHYYKVFFLFMHLFVIFFLFDFSPQISRQHITDIWAKTSCSLPWSLFTACLPRQTKASGAKIRRPMLIDAAYLYTDVWKKNKRVKSSFSAIQC